MEHIIQNFDALAVNPTRVNALSIAEAGYAAIDIGAAITRRLHIEGDKLFIDEAAHALAGRRIFFIGVGKCAIAAAGAIERLLGDRLTAGIALDVSSLEHHDLTRVEAYIGTHPLPSEVNERATERIAELLSHSVANDLMIMLISGGGSTLLCLHEESLSSLDEAALFTKLTAQGASIHDINIVRKHTSLARGGGLAKAAYPAEVISLIISDVPGNDMGLIASGPTVLDTSSIDDARAILAKYQIPHADTVAFIETPKKDEYFERVTNILFITNRNALFAMQSEAVQRGYSATIMDDRISGEAREVGLTLTEALHTSPAKTVVLYAGESTVTLPPYSGTGGRNQEMALSALTDIREDELLLPFASDGHDNTDHAGVIADATTRAHADALDLSIERHLADHRSYDFFTATGDALQTGYTGSNVSDLIIAIKN